MIIRPPAIENEDMLTRSNKSAKRNLVQKKEWVTYLSTNINAVRGTLSLSGDSLSLQTSQITEKRAGGLFDFLFSRTVVQHELVFKLDFAHIKMLRRGHYGLEKNVLEITDAQHNIYRVIVKNYQEWAALLGQPA